MATLTDITHAGRQLGRIKPKSRPRALSLSNYIDAAAADLPASTDRRSHASKSLDLPYCNDQYGCCVISDRAHSLGLQSAAATGTPILANSNEILRIYGYFSPSYNTGCVITQVLDYQQNWGLVLGGQVRKIDGYLAFDWRRPELLKAAIYLFGTVTFGLELPSDWFNSPVWDRTNAPIANGHDVAGVDYDDQGVTIATWGGTRILTWNELQFGQHLDEAYVTLAPEWFNDDKMSASGLDVDTLRSDLRKIGAGELPPIINVNTGLDIGGWS